MHLKDYHVVLLNFRHDINKAVLLSVVSAILFKMKNIGVVDILGPTHDARLGVNGSLSTYVSCSDSSYL